MSGEKQNVSAKDKAIAVIVLLFIGYLVINGLFKTEEKKPIQTAEEKAAAQEKLAAYKEKKNQIEEQGPEAYVACTQAVKKLLVSPRSAKFPFLGMGHIYKVQPDGKTAAVSAHVDSQNQFGAMIRTQFKCHMHYLGEGKWVVKNVETKN